VRHFEFVAPETIGSVSNEMSSRADTLLIAGGTSVTDLMKLGVLQPQRLVLLRPSDDALDIIEVSDGNLHIGARVTMSRLARDETIRQHFPAVLKSLVLAASPQIRNVATIAGNLMQRTRCSYYRDGQSACNKRTPGQGCAAIGGDTRSLAIVGTSSSCIANYPGDLAVALVAADAVLDIRSSDGSTRSLLIDDLRRAPGDTPHVETTLSSDDLITAVLIPLHRWNDATYVKVRDRASYAFALASVAAAVQYDADSDRISDARIVLGGIATTPFRCREAERILIGSRLTEKSVRERASLAWSADGDLDDARRFKVELTQRVIEKALHQLASR